MSIFGTQKSLLAVALAFAALALALSGCGDDAGDGATAAVATPGATGAAQSGDKQDGDKQSGDNQSGDKQADGKQTESKDPSNPGQGDEEPSSVGVHIGLAKGTFTRETTRRVHVPPGAMLDFDIRVADAEGYKLYFTSAGKTQSFYYDAVGANFVKLPALEANAVATVKLGSKKVKVTADADPGP